MSERTYFFNIKGKVTVKNDALMKDSDFSNIIERIKNGLSSLQISGVSNISVSSDDIVLHIDRPSVPINSEISHSDSTSNSTATNTFGDINDFTSCH